MTLLLCDQLCCRGDSDKTCHFNKHPRGRNHILELAHEGNGKQRTTSENTFSFQPSSPAANHRSYPKHLPAQSQQGSLTFTANSSFSQRDLRYASQYPHQTPHHQGHHTKLGHKFSKRILGARCSTKLISDQRQLELWVKVGQQK